MERIVDPVEGMHTAISTRWFSAVGSVGTPIRMAHNGTAATVYGSIRLGIGAVGLALDKLAPVDPAAQHRMQGVANGLWGDTLGRHEQQLGIGMHINDLHGNPVLPGPGSRADVPAATPHIVVLVHGLFDTAYCWHGPQEDPGLLQEIAAVSSLTPVTVDYNSGRAIAENGAQLAALLEEVVARWPVAVESVALVGHSSGGLVIRHACTVGSSLEHDWVAKTSAIITLGSPHLGTYVEKIVDVAARALTVVAETRPLGVFIGGRSRGIKDLRPGTPQPALTTHIRHHFIAGVVTRQPTNPLGRLVGDWVVRPDSATGGDTLRPATTSVLPGLSHSALRNDRAAVGLAMQLLATE